MVTSDMDSRDLLLFILKRWQQKLMHIFIHPFQKRINILHSIYIIHDQKK